MAGARQIETTAESTGSIDIIQNDEQKSRRAQRRWKILGDALKNKSVTRNDAFRGLQMLAPSRRISCIGRAESRGAHLSLDEAEYENEIDLVKKMSEALQQLGIDDTADLLSSMLEASLALLALNPSREAMPISLPASLRWKDVVQDRRDLANQLRARLSEAGYSVRVGWPERDDRDTDVVQIAPSASTSDVAAPDYVVQAHDESRVIFRERTHVRLALHDLLTHRCTGVDNTGNVAIWDAERTLVWALRQQQQQQQQQQGQQQPRGCSCPISVLELGAGMVGWAALSMIQCETVERVHITDGHENCVLNNRINVRLMQAADLIPASTLIHCSVLKWSLDDPVLRTRSIVDDGLDNCSATAIADCVFVSDCTHFTDYHAELLWTLSKVTSVDGVVWMCQPERAQTLTGFLERIRFVNRSGTTPLWVIDNVSYPELERTHQKALNDPCYLPDVHFPRIVRLTKIRTETEADRSFILLFKPLKGG